MSRSLLVAGIAALSLSACGNQGGSSNSADATGFTEDFHPEAKNSKSLTAEKKAAYAALILTDGGYHPLDSLYFEKTADLSILNPKGVSFFNKVQAGCTITPLTPTGAWESGKPQVSKEFIGGNTCPLSFNVSETDTSDITFTSTDGSSQTLNGATRSSITTSETITDPAMIKNPIFISTASTSQTNLTFNSVRTNANSQLLNGSMHFKMQNTGKLVHENGLTGKTTTKVEFSAKPGRNHLQMLVKAEFSDGGILTIGIFIHNSSLEILVGGESYTSARLKSEFGIDPSTVLKAGALHTVTALSNPSPMLLRLN